MISVLNHQQLLNGNKILNSIKIFVLFFLLGSNSFAADKKQYTTDTIQVAVIMPFCSKELLNNPNSEKAILGNACREYYQGLEIGLDSIRNLGIPVNVCIYDTKNDSNTFKQILKKNQVLNADIIFGPVVSEAQKMMANYSSQAKIYHVSPLLTMTKSKVEDPYLISVNPDLDNYADIFLEQLKINGEEKANIIILYGKGKNEKVISIRMLALKSKFPQYNIKSMELARYNEFKNHFSLGKSHHVIIDSDNEYLVNGALRMLSDSNQFTDIYVYGNKKWLNFKNINAQIWNRLNTKIITPNFMDSESSIGKQFIQQYFERYACEPNEFAVSGYDQVVYFLIHLAENNGEIIPDNFNNRQKLIGGTFQIRKKPNGKGYQNSKLNMIGFDSEYRIINVGY
jgi:ABC-type branched-subunit amino acid transport system substrate-binding protein